MPLYQVLRDTWTFHWCGQTSLHPRGLIYLHFYMQLGVLFTEEVLQLWQWVTSNLCSPVRPRMLAWSYSVQESVGTRLLINNKWKGLVWHSVVSSTASITRSITAVKFAVWQEAAVWTLGNIRLHLARRSRVAALWRWLIHINSQTAPRGH